MNRLVLLLMLGWTGAFLDAGLVDEQTGLALDAGLDRCVAGLHEQVVVEQFAVAALERGLAGNLLTGLVV